MHANALSNRFARIVDTRLFVLKYDLKKDADKYSSKVPFLESLLSAWLDMEPSL